MSKYIEDLYLELYYRFYKILNSCDNLIIAGYGFNDRGINQKIFNWLNNPSHNIVIVDPNVEDIKFKFPSHLFSNWDKNQNIKKIPFQIENINWDTIKDNIYTFNH
jgi:thiamine pyrophosphate-dependent acetolactate synthase large subunit-like protein